MGDVRTRRVSLAARPKVGKLTVPYMVDDTINPIDFKAVSNDHVARCAVKSLCGVCGGKIRRGPIAFIGPDDGRTCFADPWMHPDCAQVAMAQCPFLNDHRGWREGDPLVVVYEHNMVMVTARNWRQRIDVFGAWHFEAVGPLTRAG